MRIRLLIERNELPPVSILWSFTSTQLTSTIAQFLENVNIRFPLEGNTWGLEDYTVTLGGYEAQHYTKVGEIFKEDDEVVIKPLGFEEARARTISGRAQITRDGRRLVDGVPFGKPLLKRMRRPEVEIPPARKRVRMEEEEEEEGDEGAVVRFEEVGDEKEEDDDEEDGDFEDGGDEEENEDEADSNSSSDSSNSGFAEEEPVTVSNSTSDSSDSDSSSDDTSSSEDEAQGVGGGEKEVESDSSSDSSSSNTTSIGVGGSADAASSLGQETQLPLPSQGQQRTKERNIRRREAARLRYLKKSGELPSTTTLQQMKNWLQTGELPPAKTSDQQDTAAQELERRRQKLLSDINGGGIDVTTEVKKPAISPDMFPPQLKKARKKSKTPALLDDEGPEEIPIATEPVAVYTSNVFSAPTITAPQSATAAKRRQDKADAEGSTSEGPERVSAAQRLIYGSLGLKAPKTQADKDALQRKLADRSRKSAEQAVAEEQADQDEDPEAWRERVVMSAVECVDEGVQLSEPPFPFRQKWDPQYWSQKVKKRGAGGGERAAKKRRRNGGEDLVETYDKYNQDGGGDALNYDDPVDDDGEDDEWDEEWDNGENWQDGALLGTEENDDDDDNNDGFPTLPEDLSILAPLAEADAHTGDFIVFTEMACSDATGWQPQIVTTVACLDSQTRDDGWNVRFSRRHGGKEYDEEGNRVYKKFEMEGYDDGAEDNVREMSWGEMMDVKLLLRPAVLEVPGDEREAAVSKQIQSQLEGEMEREVSLAES